LGGAQNQRWARKQKIFNAQAQIVQPKLLIGKTQAQIVQEKIKSVKCKHKLHNFFSKFNKTQAQIVQTLKKNG